MLDLLAERPLPETHKELLGLYFETVKITDAKKKQETIKRLEKEVINLLVVQKSLIRHWIKTILYWNRPKKSN